MHNLHVTMVTVIENHIQVMQISLVAIATKLKQLESYSKNSGYK